MTEPQAQYAPETCAFCEGTDKPSEIPEEKYYQWLLCLVCRGQGSVLVAQPGRKCDRCSGDGQRAGDAANLLGLQGAWLGSGPSLIAVSPALFPPRVPPQPSTI